MSKKTKPREPLQIQEWAKLILKPSNHQPSEATMEKEFDKPGLSMDEIRAVFFRPFTSRRENFV
ncbi:MAG: hypothetical protein OXC62_14495 [Aestuariivita sp.]|nr:hypothetical protein [Aestuariivita sp.]